MPWVLGNVSGLTDAGAGQAQTTFGTPFFSAVDAPFAAYRWYRSIVTAGAKPAALKLYSVADSTLRHTAASVPDNGSLGWQVATVPDGDFLCLAGVVYVVTMDFPAGGHFGQLATQSAPSPDQPLNFSLTQTRRFTTPGAAFGFPGSGDAGAVMGIDAFLTAPGEQAGLSATDLQNGLASWLIATGDNTHQEDGLPWLIRAEIEATKAVVDTIPAIAGTEWSNLASVWDLTATLTEAERAIIRAFFQTAQPVRPEVQPWATTSELSVATDALQDQIDGLAGVVDQHLDALLLRERLDLSVDVDDLDRWRLVGTTSGEGDGLVNMQADRYTFEFTALPPAQPQHDIAGRLWVPHAGWWAPVRGGYVGPRAFLDFQLNDLRWPPYLMHGLLIYTHPGYEWLVGAWVLDRPT